MPTKWHALSVARPIPSLAIFFGVTVTYLIGGMGLNHALYSAGPVFPICLAGFLINDIFDQEADRINHPNRALTKFPALTRRTTVVYIVAFISAIVLISIQHSGAVRASWAMMLLTLSNYAFVKRNVPTLKNAYMSAVACFGLSALDLTLNQSLSGPFPYAVLGLAMFARELALDIGDADGDDDSLAKSIGLNRTKWVVLFVYLVAFTLMLQAHENRSEMILALSALGGLFLYFVAAELFGLSEDQMRPLTGLLVALPVLSVAS